MLSAPRPPLPLSDEAAALAAVAVPRPAGLTARTKQRRVLLLTTCVLVLQIGGWEITRGAFAPVVIAVSLALALLAGVIEAGWRRDLWLLTHGVVATAQVTSIGGWEGRMTGDEVAYRFIDHLGVTRTGCVTVAAAAADALRDAQDAARRDTDADPVTITVLYDARNPSRSRPLDALGAAALERTTDERFR